MDNKYNIKKARELVQKSSSMMVLSGAGLSTEAGIPDFRSKNGLYSEDFHGYNPETVLSHAFYINNTELFWEYLKTKMNYTGIKPDYSYELISNLEKQGKISSVVTQNIDSLHLDAGNKKVIEIHGSMKDCYCDKCDKRYTFREIADGKDYNCECGGIIRPDVVLYDEEVSKIAEAYIAADKSDLLLVLGTSLKVYPVAYIPQIFLNMNKPVIIINRDKTQFKGQKNVCEINDSIGKTLKNIFKDNKNQV